MDQDSCWICRRSFTIIPRYEDFWITHKDFNPELYEALIKAGVATPNSVNISVYICVVCAKLLYEINQTYLSTIIFRKEQCNLVPDLEQSQDLMNYFEEFEEEE